ncbi:MAG: threonine synthase [Chlorobi bacterium]|nr:threonine synthase [Chlorobiota bacterium]
MATIKTIHTKFHYFCTTCGKEYDNSQIRYLCPDCESGNTPDLPPKGVLKIIYDYKNIKPDFDHLKKNNFIDLLPLQSMESMPNLKIGDTPLYKLTVLGEKQLPFTLFLKDDAQNPTFSFKDRASALVSAYAKEQGIDTIITASTGNAGSSLAGICAAQKQQAIILLPENAPLAKITQSLMCGAKVVRVKGSYDEAFDLSIAVTTELGLYNRNTAFNPLTIEGKKTVAFEMFDQLNRKIPDRIFVPVGDGVIISGVYKGFEDLINLGIIDKMPVIVAVQAKGSDNLIRNIGKPGFTIKSSSTIADSISVDIPRNFYMASQFIEKYNGEFITVTDKEILSASKTLATNTGLFAEPAAAAAFAGFYAYYKNGKTENRSTNVVLLTGSGLKDLNAVSGILKIPLAINPDLNELKKILT